MTNNLSKDSTNYEKYIDYIVQQKELGIPSRHIAQVLGIGKSSVNDYYSRYLEAKEYQSPNQQEESFEDNLDILCEHPDFSVSNLAKRLRSAHRANNQLRRIQREINDTEVNFSEMIEGIEKAVANVTVSSYAPSVRKVFKTSNQDSGVIEVLFSDWQVGKIAQHYNTEIAIKAIKQYGQGILEYIYKKQDQGYFIDKIVFASLGDIVEDHMKHGIQSAVACDSGLSEQISNAIIYMWEELIEPIAQLGHTTEFVGIAGNHGSSQHKGMDIYKAGLYSYDYAIYTALKQLAKVGGYTNITFNIPEGVFGTADIYNNTIVYEHGYFNSATEKSMRDQMTKRGQQIKKHVEYFRCGDMHHVCAYDASKLVLNGALFGVDSTGSEYSGVLGFSSIPAQVIMFHQEEPSIGKSQVKETYIVQLAQI